MVKEACEENNKMFRENFYLKKNIFCIFDICFINYLQFFKNLIVFIRFLFFFKF